MWDMQLLNPSDDALFADPYEDFLYASEDVLCTLKPLYEKYSKRAIAVHGGRNRNTFILSDRLVVKLPKTLSGFSDNDWEGSVSNSPISFNNPNYVQYPRTRLAYWNKIPIVFMERITLNFDCSTTSLPWVASVDCGQVGFNRRGRLVAYDYGLN